MDDNVQTPTTNDQVQGDPAVTPVVPATPVPATPVVEEPGIEEVIPDPSPSEEPEEEESFEDADSTDTAQV